MLKILDMDNKEIRAIAYFDYRGYTVSLNSSAHKIQIFDSEKNCVYKGMTDSVSTALEIVDALKSGETK